jgi:hypothetical protein
MKNLVLLTLVITFISGCAVTSRKYIPGFYVDKLVHNKVRNSHNVRIDPNGKYRTKNLTEPAKLFDNKYSANRNPCLGKSTAMLTASIQKTVIQVKTQEFRQVLIFPSDTVKATSKKAIGRMNKASWAAIILITSLLYLIAGIISSIPSVSAVVLLSLVLGLTIFMAVLEIYRRINAMITHKPIFNHYKRIGRHTVIDPRKPPYYSLVKCIFGILTRLGFLYCDFYALLLVFLPGTFILTLGFGAFIVGLGLLVGLIIALLDLSRL